MIGDKPTLVDRRPVHIAADTSRVVTRLPDRTARMPDEGEEDFAREKAQDKGQGRVENETELDDENPER